MKLIDYLCRIKGIDRMTVPLATCELWPCRGDQCFGFHRHLYPESLHPHVAWVHFDTTERFVIRDLAGKVLLDSKDRLDGMRGYAAFALDDEEMQIALQIDEQEKSRDVRR